MVEEQERTVKPCQERTQVRIGIPHIPDRVMRVTCQLAEMHMRQGQLHADGIYRWDGIGRVEIARNGFHGEPEG